MPDVHLFASYLKPRDKDRKLSVVATRDLNAAWEVMAALQRYGYYSGSQRLDFPPPAGDEPSLLEIDCSDMLAVDIVLKPGRPPLSDKEQGERKQVQRGFTSLELQTFRVWRLYFEILSRSHAKLHSWLHQMLPAGYEGRRDAFFMQSERSDYSVLDACDGSGRRDYRGDGHTIAVVVNQPELWPGGPSYLGFFGMDAASTVAWACLLRHRHSDLLLRPGFHLVELITAPIPERVPDLRWALEWQAVPLLSVPPQPTPAQSGDSEPENISARANQDALRA